ncbi:uncharacterized protein PHALS_12521 [Plasmopara halstedii]|uniref:Uncharacterized protein n=1 Tax=Plasmopara halstedii TaxID=4781 RepID=A0A0P1ANE2_PLAHL|nr:uncharacterized protein PHALS_12521 [Plasmopara halstedii]CEG42228.1 hypothetical protein PHALS_12521 [Plasmopara halstedii]|eukprot:XP_024578597.1 hypothetical protein PHALS_12521 [Plasmopara halstedii]
MGSQLRQAKNEHVLAKPRLKGMSSIKRIYAGTCCVYVELNMFSSTYREVWQSCKALFAALMPRLAQICCSQAYLSITRAAQVQRCLLVQYLQLLFLSMLKVQSLNDDATICRRPSTCASKSCAVFRSINLASDCDLTEVCCTGQSVSDRLPNTVYQSVYLIEERDVYQQVHFARYHAEVNFPTLCRHVSAKRL